jgi:peptide/nickel transport system permease protein
MATTPTTVTLPASLEPLRASAQRGAFETALRRLWRSPNGRSGLIIVTIILLISIITPLVDPYDASQDSNLPLSRNPPSLQHPFGNDFIGRDILRRVLHGARVSLAVALITMLVGTFLSTAVGVAAGFFGGWVDTVIQRVGELMQAFPGIPLAIAIVAIFGPGLFNTVVAITIVGIPGGMRVARAVTLSLKTREYVESARALGMSELQIILRHIIPNLLPYIIVGATLGVGGVILNAAALGFLGLGAQPPTPEWGVMISEAVRFLRQSPHMAIFPGVAIILTVVGFNLLGDGLRDAIDPSLSGTS